MASLDENVSGSIEWVCSSTGTNSIPISLPRREAVSPIHCVYGRLGAPSICLVTPRCSRGASCADRPGEGRFQAKGSTSGHGRRTVAEDPPPLQRAARCARPMIDQPILWPEPRRDSPPSWFSTAKGIKYRGICPDQLRLPGQCPGAIGLGSSPCPRLPWPWGQ